MPSSTPRTASWPRGCQGRRAGRSPTCCSAPPTAAWRYDFRGKLPFSWPGSPRPPRPDGARGGVGLPGEAPLFPFGYGLTYEDVGYLPRLPEEAAPQRPRPAAASRWSPLPTATHARSELETEPTLKPRASAAMRVSAWASGMGGAVSPFLALWKRTGLMRATT